MPASMISEEAKRSKGIKQVEDDIRNLESSPLYEFRTKNGYSVVLGEGNLFAEVMLIGEAPGLQEAKKGRPFVGAAGKVLDGLLKSIGLDRESVYITNVVKDRPPDNRKPTKKEMALYGQYLSRQIDIIRPRVLVALGQTAMEYLFEKFSLAEKGQKLSQLHGKVFDAQAPYGKVKIVPLFHPAVTFYNEAYKSQLETDIHVLKQFV